MRSRRYYLVMVALALLVVGPAPLSAKETIFEFDGDWSDSLKWSNGLPEDGDDVIINADCTVDWFACIPQLNSLTINAKLDNTAGEYFWVTGNVCINSGGEFLCDGDLRVDYSLFIGDEYNNHGLTCSAIFNGTVSVGEDLDISDWYDSCSATFNKTVSVTGDYYSGSGSTVIFNETVSTGDFVAGGSVTIKKKLTCGALSVPGTFDVYADIDCRAFIMKSGGKFNLHGDYTCTVTSSDASPDVDIGAGIFQPSQGTFVLKKGDFWGPSVASTGSNYFHNLTLQGKTGFGDETRVTNFDINGNLVIASGVELITYNNNVYLAGDFTCNGTYYVGPYTPTFIFDGSGTQTLSGNVGFYHLNIASGSTVNTGNYTPSVDPSSLTENGYLVGNIKCTQDVSTGTYKFGNIGCWITGSSGTGTTTVTRHTGSTHSNAPHSLTRWFNISASNSAGVTLRLYYRDSELNNNTEANLNIWRYSGGAWTKYTPTTRDASNNYVEATVNIPSGSSDWVLSDAEDDQSLPVCLTSAVATFEGGIVKLEWEVASEVNNQGFEVHRRAEHQTDYALIGFVEGRGTDTGFKLYEYLDRAVEPYVWYLYRIYSVSLDGERKLIADGIKVYTDDSRYIPAISVLYQNRPNPFYGGTLIRFSVPERRRVEVRVYDLSGRLVRTFEVGMVSRGTYDVWWDGRDEHGSEVGAGLYICELRAGGYRTAKKMVLMKK